MLTLSSRKATRPIELVLQKHLRKNAGEKDNEAQLPGVDGIEKGWERETGRGMRYEFGLYHIRLQLHDCFQEINIREECSGLASRVWDCSVYTTKWIEAQYLVACANGQNPRSALARALKVSDAKAGVDRPLKILELGAGTGMLSIALAKFGAAVMSTEYGPGMKQLQRNCSSNEALYHSNCTGPTLNPGLVCCKELDWYKTSGTLKDLFRESEVAEFDVIVVTDCSLSVSQSNIVLKMIQKYGTPCKSVAIVGLCNEREGTPWFKAAARALFPEVETIPQSEAHSNYQTARQTIIRIRL